MSPWVPFVLNAVCLAAYGYLGNVFIRVIRATYESRIKKLETELVRVGVELTALQRENERRRIENETLERRVGEALQGLAEVCTDLSDAAKEVRENPPPGRPTAYERIINDKNE